MARRYRWSAGRLRVSSRVPRKRLRDGSRQRTDIMGAYASSSRAGDRRDADRQRRGRGGSPQTRVCIVEFRRTGGFVAVRENTGVKEITPAWPHARPNNSSTYSAIDVVDGVIS